MNNTTIYSIDTSTIIDAPKNNHTDDGPSTSFVRNTGSGLRRDSADHAMQIVQAVLPVFGIIILSLVLVLIILGIPSCIRSVRRRWSDTQPENDKSCNTNEQCNEASKSDLYFF